MPTTPRARSRSLLLAAGIGLVAGCNGGGPARNARAAQVDAGSPVSAECPEEAVPPGVERLSLTAEDGTPIGAATVGTGETAVVLVHGSGQDLCDWLPFVARLEDLGVTVAAYDLRGRGASGGSKTDTASLPGDLATVVAALRNQGAQRVVLVGASLGAATALVASARIEPPVDAVVAVSPPISLGGVDVESEARHFGGPIYLVAAKGDDTFAANAQDLAEVLPAVRGTTVLDGSQHGMRLILAQPDEVLDVIRHAAEASSEV